MLTRFCCCFFKMHCTDLWININPIYYLNATSGLNYPRTKTSFEISSFLSVKLSSILFQSFMLSCELPVRSTSENWEHRTSRVSLRLRDWDWPGMVHWMHPLDKYPPVTLSQYQTWVFLKLGEFYCFNSFLKEMCQSLTEHRNPEFKT